jgi:uncharacterized membrane protein
MPRGAFTAEGQSVATIMLMFMRPRGLQHMYSALTQSDLVCGRHDIVKRWYASITHLVLSCNELVQCHHLLDLLIFQSIGDFI